MNNLIARIQITAPLGSLLLSVRIRTDFIFIALPRQDVWSQEMALG